MSIKILNRKANQVIVYNNKPIELKAICSKVDLINEEKDYYESVKDLIENKIILRMKDYIQHGTTTCYQHCINVSYYNYKICKFLGFDSKSAARAGLLHDLFLYDWHIYKTPKGFFNMHGFTHANTALENADQYFKLNNIEKEIIKKHMWPLNISIPRYKETFVIILVDKFCSLSETLSAIFSRNINAI